MHWGDLSGKEVQKGEDLCICMGDSFYYTVESNTGFPGGSDGKESACSAGDRGLIPG